jgi:hypothetical protein
MVRKVAAKPTRPREEKRAQIASVESRWGVQLPHNLVEIAIEHEGESPEPGRFRIGDGTASCVNCFYVFEIEPANYNIERSHKSRSDSLPALVFPIACDPGGNDICLDYRTQGAEPAVALYDHETGRVIPVAANFDDFMAGLY